MTSADRVMFPSKHSSLKQIYALRLTLLICKKVSLHSREWPRFTLRQIQYIPLSSSFAVHNTSHLFMHEHVLFLRDDSLSLLQLDGLQEHCWAIFLIYFQRRRGACILYPNSARDAIRAEPKQMRSAVFTLKYASAFMPTQRKRQLSTLFCTH